MVRNSNRISSSRLKLSRLMLTLKRMPSQQTAQLLLVPLLAIVVTWRTGLVLIDRIFFGDIGVYGFPLAWKTQFGLNCPVGGGGRFDILTTCYVDTVYQWMVFGLDAVLYMGLGYSIILFSRKRWSTFIHVMIPVSAAWLTSATGYFFSVSTQLGKSNGFPFPYTVNAFFFLEGYFNWSWFAIDTALFATLEYLGLFLYRGFRLSKSDTRTPRLVISRQTLAVSQ